MRCYSVLIAVLALAGCSRSLDTTEAVRQGVIDSVAGKVNVGAMDVDVTSVAFRGQEADATVTFRPRGGGGGAGIQMKYTLEKKSGKWVVKERADAAGSPHGAGAMGGGAGDAHGGGLKSGQLPRGHPSVEPGEGKK